MNVLHAVMAYSPIGLAPLILAFAFAAMAWTSRSTERRFALSVGDLHAHGAIVHSHRHGSDAHAHGFSVEWLNPGY